MTCYQSLSQTSSHTGDNNVFVSLIHRFFLFTIDVSLALISNLFGFQNTKDNDFPIINEIVPVHLQPSASVNGFPSLRFDANEKSFENHRYHPWLVIVISLLAVVMLGYDLNKSYKKSTPLREHQHIDEEEMEEADSGFMEEELDDEPFYREDLPVLQRMPKTFRTQRKEVGLPYQDVTVSKSTPLSLLLWETK